MRRVVEDFEQQSADAVSHLTRDTGLDPGQRVRSSRFSQYDFGNPSTCSAMWFSTISLLIGTMRSALICCHSV